MNTQPTEAPTYKAPETDEERAQAIKEYIDKTLTEGTLGPNLQSAAMAANRWGLNVSRQTLHNWYNGYSKPSYTLLESYIRILKLNKRLAPDAADFETIEAFIDFFETIRTIAHG